jgi:hypothetical protein
MGRFRIPRGPACTPGRSDSPAVAAGTRESTPRSSPTPSICCGVGRCAGPPSLRCRRAAAEAEASDHWPALGLRPPARPERGVAVEIGGPPGPAMATGRPVRSGSESRMRALWRDDRDESLAPGRMGSGRTRPASTYGAGAGCSGPSGTGPRVRRTCRCACRGRAPPVTAVKAFRRRSNRS